MGYKMKVKDVQEILDWIKSELNDKKTRIKSLESAMQESIKPLQELAYHLNMEFYTASGDKLQRQIDIFKKVLNEQ